MLIRINGRDSEVPQGATIWQLMSGSGFAQSLVVVELNGAVLARESWEIALKDKDSLEIVRLIGGG